MFGLFSRGDIVITLEKYNYHPGETIKGTISLKLKKPTQADKFSVSLKGEQTIKQSGAYRNIQGNQQQIKNVIYQFELPMDGQKEYSEAQYPFEIFIPADILPQSGNSLANASIGGVDIGGILSGVAGMAMGIPVTSTRTDWSLHVALDIPGVLDMRKSIQINIG